MSEKPNTYIPGSDGIEAVSRLTVNSRAISRLVEAPLAGRHKRIGIAPVGS